MAAKEPKQRRTKPSKENEEDMVMLQAFKSTIAWWRLLHVPTEIFSQQWVEPYCYPVLSDETILLPIIYFFITNDKVWYHIIVMSNNIEINRSVQSYIIYNQQYIWYKVNS